MTVGETFGSGAISFAYSFASRRSRVSNIKIIGSKQISIDRSEGRTHFAYHI